MWLELQFQIEFCASCTTPSLSCMTGMKGIPTPGNMKNYTILKNGTSFRMSAPATYSASIIESVMHFLCPIEQRHTQLIY